MQYNLSFISPPPPLYSAGKEGSFMRKTKPTAASVEAAVARALQEERTRIAHELHDTLAQCWTAIALQVEAVEGTFDAPEPVRAALNTIRRVAREGQELTRAAVFALHSTEEESALD